MTDPDDVLEPRGPNTQHPDVIRFRSPDDITRLHSVISAYLDEAMAYAEAGIRPEKSANIPEFPTELVDALDADPELSEAFHALTLGRQRSYLINLNSAKKAETRQARISRFRDRIFQGKGALER